MGNSSGNSTERRTLQYHDRLPRSVRAAVANARFDWALRNWLKMFETNRISAAALVKRIQNADREHSAKDRLKVWGPDYPVLKGELKTPTSARRKR